jgi:hypothetical protein
MFLEFLPDLFARLEWSKVTGDDPDRLSDDMK